MKAPWFPWWPKDFDTDERVRLMDDADIGFFARCLNHSWLNDGLPESIQEIARMLRCRVDYAQRRWLRVGPCWDLIEGRYRNPKQETFRAKTAAISDKRKGAAEERWNSIEVDVKSKGDKRSISQNLPPNEGLGRIKNEQVQTHQQNADANACGLHPYTRAFPFPYPYPEEEKNTPLTPRRGECEQTPLPPDSAEVAIRAPSFDESLIEIATRIHDRHPALRRCGLKEVADKLRTIAKQVPAKERIDRLCEIEKCHADWCDHPDWQKEGGQYAKGLDNWLAPTKGRFNAQAPPIPEPSRCEQPSRFPTAQERKRAEVIRGMEVVEMLSRRAANVR